MSKKIWRVQLGHGERDRNKMRMYDRGSKTYANYNHALAAYKEFTSRGIKVELLEATVSDWYPLDITGDM